MFDAALLPIQRRVIHRPAVVLYEKGVSADQITLVGFVLGLFAVGAVMAGWLWTALVLLAANRVADGLDGAVARLGTPTDRGAFMDIALDFVFYALFPVGFAVLDPEANALPAAVLLASFVGTGSSFLAFSILAQKRGVKSTEYPTKGIYYLGGLTEGAETIALFVAFCLWPGLFPVLAYGFSLACAATTLTRWMAGWTMFDDSKAAIARRG